MFMNRDLGVQVYSSLKVGKHDRVGKKARGMFVSLGWNEDCESWDVMLQNTG